MKYFRYCLTILLLILLPTLLLPSEKKLVMIDDIYPHELKMQGFQLSQETEIEIQAVGAYQRSSSNHIMFGIAWILDGTTREVVWEMEPVERRTRRIKAREQQAKLTLPAGVYEAYFSSFPYNRSKHEWDYGNNISIGRFVSGLLTGFDDDWERRDFDRACEQFFISIDGNGEPLTKADILNYLQQREDKAIALLDADRDNYISERAFELKREIEVSVRALGELRESGRYDYGWIIDADSRKKIWQMQYWDSEPAGGASKNRMVETRMNLPAGRYVALYVSDDSHSPIEWNSPPPYDPYGWGLTISPVNPSDKQFVESFNYQKDLEQRTLMSMTRVRDSEYIARGFELLEDSDVRIYALGEGRDGDMFDYGWIIDAKSRKKIWEMHYHNTDHAGGAHKNRLFDDIIHLEKGKYIAMYQTDGTHSYFDWNSSQPYEEEMWGMTIYAASETFNLENFKEIDIDAESGILARIWRVGDHARKRDRFTLDEPADVRVYAIGEGSRGDMYDYGWIEDDDGRVVWEMRYRDTDHAGGASKNRVMDEILFLKAGTYHVYYETDDSHSYNDWNSTPPHDATHWGITVFKIE